MALHSVVAPFVVLSLASKLELWATVENIWFYFVVFVKRLDQKALREQILFSRIIGSIRVKILSTGL